MTNEEFFKMSGNDFNKKTPSVATQDDNLINTIARALTHAPD